LLNNNLTKEELLNLKNNLIDQKDQLKNKLESINGYSETFEFVSSDKNITKKNLLGKIFTKQVTFKFFLKFFHYFIIYLIAEK